LQPAGQTRCISLRDSIARRMFPNDLPGTLLKMCLYHVCHTDHNHHFLKPNNLEPPTTTIMNFYPPPPTLEATLYVRIPDHLRCIDQETEWTSGFDTPFQHVFLEGPVADDLGNLYVVDIPFGRILQIDTSKNISVVARWDGEPNGLAATADGDLLIADYKQVGIRASSLRLTALADS
jgi:hypothetical protein